MALASSEAMFSRIARSPRLTYNFSLPQSLSTLESPDELLSSRRI